MSTEATRSSDHVIAQRYQIKNHYARGYQGNRTEASLTIFVGEGYNLEISEEGDVLFTERPSQTLAGFNAMQTVMGQINQRMAEAKNYVLDEKDEASVYQAADEADQMAYTPVPIPRDLLNRIRTLYNRSVDSRTPSDQVPSIKAELIQVIQDSGLFSI